MIPMTKSWRPIWSLVEATQNKPDGRNKLTWLKKWGDMPKGMEMKSAKGTISEKKLKNAPAPSKKPVSRADFEKAKAGLMANLKKNKVKY